jgi:alkylation response protein AidB-like acyl-CoA dehydrogenase
MLQFEWDDAQLAYRDSLRNFARRELDEKLRERDAGCAFSEDAWRKCAEVGIQGLPVPAEYGGSDASPTTIALALETLGYGCRDNGLLFSLNAQMWSCETPIVRFGTDEQRRRYLPGLCDGSLIAAHGMSEADTGSDAFALAAVADPDPPGDWYLLNGRKVWSTNAPVAGLFLVFARIRGLSGLGAISAFLVDGGTPGLETGPPVEKMGLRTSPMSEVILEDCRVPTSAMLGSPGSGMAIFNSSMDWERSFILATAVGTAARHLDETVAYAKSRKQFDQPISQFQAVSHRIVDMRVRLEAARLLLYRVAWKKEHGQSTATESAITKLFLSEMVVQSSLDALQVHGALGYTVEYGLEREVRDALASQFYSGTSDMQRNIIARRMGL